MLGRCESVCLRRRITGDCSIHLDCKLQLHHGYPCTLADQYLNGMESVKAQHEAAHAYLRGAGFPFGNEGRTRWGQLSLADQKYHIRKSLLAAGVSEKKIKKNLGKVTAGSSPGSKSPRVGRLGPTILSLGGTTLVMMPYDNYLGAGEIGMERASQFGWCESMKLYLNNPDMHIFETGRYWAIIRFGVRHNVEIVRHGDSCFLVVSHSEDGVVYDVKLRHKIEGCGRRIATATGNDKRILNARHYSSEFSPRTFVCERADNAKVSGEICPSFEASESATSVWRRSNSIAFAAVLV